MSPPHPRWVIAAGLAAILPLAGCSAGGERHAVGDLVGKSLAETHSWVPVSATYLVQDASLTFGRDPAYSASQADSPVWQIIAACADDEHVEDSETVEIAVVPGDLVTNDNRSDVLAGEYSTTVTCEGRTYR